MIPDLPVELWLYILSLLPRAQLPKLLGVNRVCSARAMDEIYREVLFTDDGGAMLKTFRQLQYPAISSRVQHVYIQPRFFPEMAAKPRFLKLMKRRMLHFRRKQTQMLFFNPRDDVLFIAQCALVNCTEATELTIALHDFILPASFGYLLETVWTSLGPNLHRLTLNATLAKFPLILKDSLLSTLPNLTDLCIILSISKFPPTHKQHTLAIRALSCLLNALTVTLQSLTLYSYELEEIVMLFQALRYFPHLQKLAIHVAEGQDSFVPQTLTQFLARHENTVKHFALLEPFETAPWNKVDLMEL
ncbi:hypothetical protein BDZ94DRAFT_1248505 [Collybia nuda]|uniref:F-box domain-containing protein n=1 Tax=Collybia nuda TaxID=64659 RepID=A0A9P5YE51_9AGAR|nr:hypothetical protein BDZ94DRAFT_1248505 [Collybia nuda]